MSLNKSFSPTLINKSIGGSTIHKRKVIKGVKDDCKLKIKLYRKRYKKLKRIDNVLDITNSFLNASAIALIVSGFTMPPLLIASASCSGVNFVMERIQDKTNLKQKIEELKQTINQYNAIVNEIVVVLNKNNLTSEQYTDYLQEIYDKIELISEYSQII
jgi:hypothetical protein